MAIQDAMGRLDYHLDLFNVRNPRTGDLAQIGIPDDDAYLIEPPCLASLEMPIAGYFVKEGDVTHPEHEAMLQWLSGAYDAEAFSASDVKFDDPNVRWRNAFTHR